MITYLIVAFLTGESFALAFDSYEACRIAESRLVTTELAWSACNVESVE